MSKLSSTFLLSIFAPDTDLAAASYPPKPTTSASGEFFSVLPDSPSPYFDVVLMTSDGVGYLAHESTAKARPSDLSHIPVYEVSASSSTIRILLRMLYPGPISHPSALTGTDSIDNPSSIIRALWLVLIAAKKFSMPKIAGNLCMTLLDVANIPTFRTKNTLPLSVYVIACQFRLADVAKAAAYACLWNRGFEGYTEQLVNLRSDQYFKLLDYRRKVDQAVSEAMGVFLRSYQSLLPCKSASTLCSTTTGWEKYIQLATDVLRDAPRSEEIYSITFLPRVVLEQIMGCRHRSTAFVAEWDGIQRALRKRIENAIASLEVVYKSAFVGHLRFRRQKFESWGYKKRVNPSNP
ncbi:hypothetical protein DFH11DRAFT_1547174 [Phellopilus nigrolimitatus]|nr:hypothetical protein DFH11DRAFT_1547174 [Phellopilus nigrolimitatus]